MEAVATPRAEKPLFSNKALKKLIFPLVIEQFLAISVGFCDTVMISGLGDEAISGVSLVDMIMTLMINVFAALATGGAVVAAQFIGAKRAKDARNSASQLIFIAFIISIVLMALTLVFKAQLLRLFFSTLEEGVMQSALTYFWISALSFPFLAIYNCCAALFRAMGNSKISMLASLITTIMNIIGNAILIYGVKWGVAGAAAATVLSQVVSAVLVMMTLCRSPQVYRVQLKKIRFYGDMLVRIVRIGLPAGLQSVMYSLSNIIIQASVNGFGTDVMAAYTAYGKVDGMYWMVINAFGVAITTFVGQNFGARLYDRMKKSINVCLGIAAAVTLLLSGVLMVVAEPLLGLFSDDAQVLEIGLSIVRLIVPTYITYIFIEILSGAMRGAGDSLIPTIMTLTGVCLLRVFWVTVVVSAHHELNVLLLSYPITWIVTSGMFMVYYLRGRWLKRCIALQNAEN